MKTTLIADDARDRPAGRCPLGRLRARASARAPSTTSARGRGSSSAPTAFGRATWRSSEGGSLTGVLPLFRKKGLVSDARLRSIPVFSYGGPLGGRRGLERELIEAARDLGAADGEIPA